MFFVHSVSTSKTLRLFMLAGTLYMIIFVWTETNPPGTKFLEF